MLIKVLAVVGPTASGKSELAIKLARRFGGEIISADSRQVYRGLDIGSGKVMKAEQKLIPHHLLDVTSPRKTFSGARYQVLAERALIQITKRGHLPIICGGSGQYVDAALGRLILPPVPPNSHWRRVLEKLSTEELFTRLQILDPRRATLIDRYNRRRLTRAIEVVKALGSVPELNRGEKYSVLLLGIKLAKDKLRRRIKIRLRRRWRKGLVEEVRNLHATGLSWHRLDELGLEYRWAAHYLQGQLTEKEVLKKLETEIWHYAKRQLTWFKRDLKINWITNGRQAEKLCRDFVG